MSTEDPSAAAVPGDATPGGRSPVLLILASGQFLMTLDTSVMNVSIIGGQRPRHDGHRDPDRHHPLHPGMAALMITGGKIGAIIGRRRAFAIGLSSTARLAGHRDLPQPTVLIIGCSVLEGLGAALIMPAIVALVAGNFPKEGRSAAYGRSPPPVPSPWPPDPSSVVRYHLRLVAMGVRGEVVIVPVILVRLRAIQDTPPVRAPFDLLGAVLSVAGLSLTVYGVLRSGTWGWVRPKPGAHRRWPGISLVLWLVLGGPPAPRRAPSSGSPDGVARGKEPLLRPVDVRPTAR